MEDDRKPWWEDDPELQEIRRRTLEEFQRGPEDLEPLDPDAPDPVLADFLDGASIRELTDARDELTRAHTRYEQALRAARAAGLSWAEIGRVLGVSKQLLHRRFRTQSG